MSLEQLEKTLLEMPSEERRQFARWFYDHEGEILDSTVEDSISPAVKAEIVRRRQELDATPGLAVPVTDEWFEQLKRKLG